jgi:hypothetical protein
MTKAFTRIEMLLVIVLVVIIGLPLMLGRIHKPASFQHLQKLEWVAPGVSRLDYEGKIYLIVNGGIIEHVPAPEKK